jgi:hypothetical protein
MIEQQTSGRILSEFLIDSSELWLNRVWAASVEPTQKQHHPGEIKPDLHQSSHDFFEIILPWLRSFLRQPRERIVRHIQ